MTTEEKVALVEGVWETYGLAPALAAVELPKSTWYYHQNEKVSYEEKYAYLLPDLLLHQGFDQYGVSVALRCDGQQSVCYSGGPRCQQQCWQTAAHRVGAQPSPEFHDL